MKEADRRLVEAAMNGDSHAYGVIVGNYTGFIYSMALRMTSDHHLAEDLCQEIFLRGWMKLRALQDPAAFPGWIAALSRRQCLNAIANRSRKQEVGEEESELERLNPTLPDFGDSPRRILEEAIALLPLRDREIVTLCYFQELTSPEVAGVLGISEGSVRVYLHRARSKLKEILKGREHELMG